MSQTHEFRAQTGTPAPLISGQFTYYVNQSGVLRYITTGSADRPVASVYPETGAKSLAGLSNVSTGNITFTAGVNTVVYGASGNSLNSLPTVLGEPTMWIRAFGPNGELLAVPAYTRGA